MRFLTAGLLALTVLLPLFARPARAESPSLKVWIDLRDKGPAMPAPAGSRAFEDAPVHAPYLDSLNAAGLRVSVTLKWQNKVSGWTDSASLPALRALPFVRAVEAIPRKAPASTPPRARADAGADGGAPFAKASAGPSLFGTFDSVFARGGASPLRDTLAARGLRGGEGLVIAVLDEDFHLGHEAFDSLFASGRLADQWDFVADTSAAVDRRLLMSHGAMVLSPLAADAPGVAVGLVPRARYLLYRTENAASETYAEEDFLAAGLERAVDSGAHVINVSLGYRYDFSPSMPLREFPLAMMDGRTRPASIAALGAARRGALVVVATGNEAFDHPDPSLTSPSDADSILSIGILDPAATSNAVGGWCAYSSTGNTADGRLKPELSAPSMGCGVPVIHPGEQGGIRTVTGTSFGAPIVAGVGAVLRQLHPTKNAQDIRAALMVTGARSGNPDARVGNGLVRGRQAHCALLRDSLVQTPCADLPPPRAVKSMFVWRGGDVVALPWANGLDLARPRLWDLQGRPHKVETFRDENGVVRLRSRSRIAPGSYLLRIPRLPGDSLSN